MASRSQQSSAKATRTFSALSQAISNPSEHQRTFDCGTAIARVLRPSSGCDIRIRHYAQRQQKVHSLVDKVYSRKNLKLARERVRANQGASGADKVTIEEFETRLDENLERLHQELRENTYQPQAVRRLEIPKRGAPGKTRPLGIPTHRA